MDFVSIRVITDDVARLAGFYERATGWLYDYDPVDHGPEREPTGPVASRNGLS